MSSANTPLSFFPHHSAIIFAAHPTDEILGCGGLIAGFRHSGTAVRIVLATLGSSGSLSPETAVIRKQECRDAAEILGGADYIFWGEPNDKVSYNERTIALAMVAIRDSDPGVIFVPSFLETHENNRSLAWTVIEATRRLSTEGKSLRVAMYPLDAHMNTVDVAIDITQWLPLKQSALSHLQSIISAQVCEYGVCSPNHSGPHRMSLDMEATEGFRILDQQALRQSTLLLDQTPLQPKNLDLHNSIYCQFRVAILIRSLDRNTLNRALNSVALQTYPNIDIHVLNVTGKRHRPIGNKVGRFSVVFHDSGVPVQRSAAGNLLLDYAKGDFALFLDDDDWLAPDHIANLVVMLENHTEAAGAYADVEYGQLIGGEWQPERLFSAPFDRNRLLFENYLPIHAVLFRQKYTRPGGGENSGACRFDQNLDLFEDWDFWLQLTSQANLIHLEKVSAYYLHHDGNQSAVFEEGDLQRQTRDYLLDKWRQRIDCKAFIGLLDYLQSTYREKSTLEDKVLAMEADTLQQIEHYRSLQTLLTKRDRELANTKRHLKSTQSILNSRLVELENAHEHTASLQGTLAARDEELLNAREHTVSLRKTLAARDEELRNAHEHAASLRVTLAARNEELLNSREYVASLRETLAARDEELLNSHGHAASLQETLAARDEELRNAHELAARLQESLAAREDQLLNSRKHADSLQETLAARDQEILNILEHAEALGLIIKARDEEINNLHDRIGDLSKVIAARDSELSSLHKKRLNTLRLLK